jgi:hypothetical protein
MNSMHLKVVFTTLQFTSYRCYGEAHNIENQSKERKIEIKSDLQLLWCYSLHTVAEGLELAEPDADVVLQ